EHVTLQWLEYSRHPGLPGGLLGRQSVQLVFGEAFVFQCRYHVIVAGDQPDRLFAWQADTVDRRFGAQARVERIRVGLKLRAGDIDVHDRVHLNLLRSAASRRETAWSIDRVIPPIWSGDAGRR